MYKMLFFVIELDEERIKKDGIINLDVAYECIEETFVQRDVTLYCKEGTMRYYTRNIDKHDFSYLWMVNSPFQECSWFLYYIKTWRFLDIDEKSNKIRTNEDIMKSWVTKRPKRP
jgi:hypothetical protein